MQAGAKDMMDGLADILPSTILLIMSVMLRAASRKEANLLFGYRTERSMKNAHTWRAANTYASRVARFFSIMLVPASVILFLYVPSPYDTILSLSSMGVCIILTLILTEVHLKRKFDAEGNPKGHSRV